MHILYILRSRKDSKLYAGYTTDMRRRFGEHQAGRVSSTKERRPLVLIFMEIYPNKGDALRREQYFKTTEGKKALRRMLRETFSCGNNIEI